ncbi:MAG: XdhC family protein [Bdellovibrionales bacterium]|nr:XdhC family protein [Bdellovibrionales bacterium]
MRELKELFQFMQSHQGEPMLMVTLVATEGSTYKKPGAKKLILLDQKNCGLISGGCLEQEIIDFALAEPAQKRVLLLDTTEESDPYFGSGVGCQGSLHLFFEPVRWEIPNTPLVYLGLSTSQKGRNYLMFDQNREDFGFRICIEGDNQILFSDWTTSELPRPHQLFCDPWQRDLHIKLVGAGVDTDPLYSLINTLGWDLQVFDYRQEWVQQRLDQGWNIRYLSEGGLDPFLKPGANSVLLLMSHHYPYDLEVFSKTDLQWLSLIGVLGPQARRQKLIDDRKNLYNSPLADEDLEKIHGPMGIDGMGRGESAIALSICAQLQQFFFSGQEIQI